MWTPAGATGSNTILTGMRRGVILDISREERRNPSDKNQDEQAEGFAEYSTIRMGGTLVKPFTRTCFVPALRFEFTLFRLPMNVPDQKGVLIACRRLHLGCSPLF